MSTPTHERIGSKCCCATDTRPTRRPPGWLGYTDEKMIRLAKQAVADGFRQIKLKVGADLDDDLRRTRIAREAIGDSVGLAVDANQVWMAHEAMERGSTPSSLPACHGSRNPLTRRRARPSTHPRRGDADPDRHGGALRQPGDVQAVLAGGRYRHRPNRRGSGRRGQREPGDHAAGHAVRPARLSARRRGRALRACSAPGDVRLHRDRRARWKAAWIEYVDHLHEHFVDPVRLVGGRYHTPTRPGMSAEMVAADRLRYSYPDGATWAPMAQR